MSLGLWLAIIAYCLGLGTGWMIWRAAPKSAPKSVQGENQNDAARTAEPVAVANPDQMAVKLEALRKEIEAAKSRLDADADENAVLSELIDALEAAVKRSTARLNSMLYAVEKRAAEKDGE
ncbi:MAG: hypothetical protein AAGC77_01900 [Pseudomonadota bacterium]